MIHLLTHSRNATGQTAAEYAVILALLVVVVMSALPVFGETVLRLFTSFTTAFGG